MEVKLHRNFEKRFIKPHPKLKERFKERRNLFLKEPFHPVFNNHPLTGDRTGQWSINVTGDWRALYVFQGKDTVVFTEIDTHSNLYE